MAESVQQLTARLRAELLAKRNGGQTQSGTNGVSNPVANPIKPTPSGGKDFSSYSNLTSANTVAAMSSSSPEIEKAGFNWKIPLIAGGIIIVLAVGIKLAKKK